MSLKAILITLVIVVGIVSLWVGAFLIRRNDPPPRSRPSSDATASWWIPSPKDAIKNKLVFEYKWRKDGFDTLMVADFVFVNASEFPIKDITVTCSHSAASGTEIDSNTRTIYQTVPAKTTRRVSNFDMGFIHSQAVSTRCRINDYEM